MQDVGWKVMEFIVGILGGFLGGIITVVAICAVLMGDGPEGEERE